MSVWPRQGCRVICYTNHVYLNIWVIWGFYCCWFMERLFGTANIATILCNFLEDMSLPNETSRAVWDFCLNVPPSFFWPSYKTGFLFRGKEALWSVKGSSACHSSSHWALCFSAEHIPCSHFLPHIKSNPDNIPEKASSVNWVLFGGLACTVLNISVLPEPSRMLNIRPDTEWAFQ